MSESQVAYQKIEELIKDPEEVFFNYDPTTFMRTRDDEIVDPIEGEITGEIPKWIKGSLIQNGPGAFKIGDISLNHVFDGMALLHRYNIDNGKVTYQCRFVKSDALESIKSQNRMRCNEFGTTIASNGSFLQKLRAMFQKEEMTDNTLVTVYPVNSDMFAFTETPIIRKFDVKTLDTLEKYDLHKSTSIIFQPAHPHIYEGSLYNCGLSISSDGSFYIIFCVPGGDEKFENVKIISKIPAKRKFNPGYMHSFGITENYFVIIEQPMGIAALQMRVASYFKSPTVNAFKWIETENTYIYLVDRVTGEVKHEFETEKFFYFHTINQYEKDGHVVLDLICYKDAQIIKGLLLSHLKKLKNEKIKTDMLNSRALRFVLPLNGKNEESSESKNLVTLSGSNAVAFSKPNGTVFCAPELLCDFPMEFGTIWYEKYLGKRYKYFYSVGFAVHSECPGKLIKVDVDNKVIKIWQEENAYPSEPLFIPSPDPKSEDDGVVIASILYDDPEANRVTFLVLDAKTFQELGRCDFKNLSNPVTKVFHGWFVNGK